MYFYLLKIKHTGNITEVIYLFEMPQLDIFSPHISLKKSFAAKIYDINTISI